MKNNEEFMKETMGSSEELSSDIAKLIIKFCKENKGKSALGPFVAVLAALMATKQMLEIDDLIFVGFLFKVLGRFNVADVDWDHLRNPIEEKFIKKSLDGDIK